MAVQYERIKKTIAALAAYGTLPQGGTTRLSYTAEYLAAQAFFAAGNAGVGHVGRGRPDWESDWDLCGTRA